MAQFCSSFTIRLLVIANNANKILKNPRPWRKTKQVKSISHSSLPGWCSSFIRASTLEVSITDEPSFPVLPLLLHCQIINYQFTLKTNRYESANYLNFVNQYFGSPEFDHKKLMILGNAIANQFNPLDSFNDLVTPVSIQVSEKYQNLLQDYCIQQTDDFLQSQIYLCIIVVLLIIFSSLTRNNHRSGTSTSRLLAGHSVVNGINNINNNNNTKNSKKTASTNAKHLINTTLTSGKLLASEHEANLNITSSSSPDHRAFHHFGLVPGSPGSASSSTLDTGKLFIVSIINASIYGISIIIHVYGNNSSNRDLISSVTMVLIAFVTLVGIFLPILHQIHRYDTVAGSLSRPIMSRSQTNSSKQAGVGQKLGMVQSSSSTNAFSMFPEFSPIGVRRPSSDSGDSSSGSSSRKPFAETKESRRNMGFTLANLGPPEESLRGMGFYDPELRESFETHQLDPTMISLKLNEALINDHHSSSLNISGQEETRIKHRLSKTQSTLLSNSNGGGEKRLIMLDVDPCCPKHGLSARHKNEHENHCRQHPKPTRSNHGSRHNHQ